MVLTSDEIKAKGIVINARESSRRRTTYDATVGAIIKAGKAIQIDSHTLQPREIVWVISNEEFDIPDEVTGVATLRTTWTHNGILALNVGVVDPGWKGPLATALVNFGNSDFVITKGDAFFRVIFHKHPAVPGDTIEKSVPEYRSEVIQKSRIFSSTFLNMESLVGEVSREIFKLPKLAVVLAWIAIVISILAIYAPISWSVFSENKDRLARLDAKVEILEDEQISKDQVENLTRKLHELDRKLTAYENGARHSQTNPPSPAAPTAPAAPATVPPATSPTPATPQPSKDGG